MLRPDDVQALNDSERAKIDKIEAATDAMLKADRGHTSIALNSVLWREAYILARMYAGAGWEVRLERVRGGWLLVIAHPTISAPRELLHEHHETRHASIDTPWFNDDGEKQAPAG